MQTRVFWIIESAPGALGIMARPAGGGLLATELRALQEMGVSTVVSLVTEAEQWELDLTGERELCEDYGLGFVSFPIEDRQHPRDMLPFLRLVESLLESILQTSSARTEVQATLVEVNSVYLWTRVRVPAPPPHN